MEHLTIIAGESFKQWEIRLTNIEQNQLAIMKLIQQLLPPIGHSNNPDYISITDACKKYHVSKVTINKKMKAYKMIKNREIDRLQAGLYLLINEAELQEALRIKGHYKLAS